MDTRLSGERTRSIGPETIQLPQSMLLGGGQIDPGMMLYDRPTALRNLQRALPNMSSGPRIKSIENGVIRPDLSLRYAPPSIATMQQTPTVTQNDASNYTIPKRSQISDQMVEQQIKAPLPQMLQNPAESQGFYGDNEAYLRVPKRNSMDVSFGLTRNDQDARLYINSNPLNSITDINRLQFLDRASYATQSTPRDSSELFKRSEMNFNRQMFNKFNTDSYILGSDVTRRTTSNAEIAMDTRRM